MSYATMQDVSFALVTDCELRDRPRQHLEPESAEGGAGSVAPRNPQGSGQVQGSIVASPA